jgi:hypothetical protein
VHSRSFSGAPTGLSAGVEEKLRTIASFARSVRTTPWPSMCRCMGAGLHGPRRGDRWQVSKWSDRCPSSNSAQRLRAHPARRCMRQRTTRTSELSRSADNRTHQFQRGLMNMLGRHAEMSGARDKPSRKWVNRCTGAIDAQAQPIYRAYRPWRGRALLRQPLHRHQRRKNRVLCGCSSPLWAHRVNISSRRCGNFCTHA